VTQEESIEFNSETPFQPIFNSYNKDCQTDYRDGYPAWYGRFNVSISDIGFDRDISPSYDEYSDLRSIIQSEMPTRDISSGTEISALFTFFSGVSLAKDDPEYIYYRPIRFDCDCLRYDCGTPSQIGTNVPECSTAYIQDNYFGIDQLIIQPSVILQEKYGTHSLRFNGAVTNFLGMGETIPPSGNIKYKDSWDDIYQITWTFNNNILDITFVVSQPYIWGQPITGYVGPNYEVFINGMITSTHQVYLFSQDQTQWSLRENLSTQTFGLVQTNVICSNPPFADPFVYHFDNRVSYSYPAFTPRGYSIVTSTFEGEVVAGGQGNFRDWVFPNGDLVVPSRLYAGRDEDVIVSVTSGPCWVDVPISVESNGCTWSNVNPDGNLSPPSGSSEFGFIDVWPAITARLGQ